MRHYKMNGGIDSHLVSRGTHQYDFPGNMHEFRKVMKAFKRLVEEQNGRFQISREALSKTSLKGELRKKTEKMIARNEEKNLVLFIEITFGIMGNIKQINIADSANRGV